MATIPLPPDFKDLLRLLRTEGVRYLLVGGYAVSYHGYPRGTADMDVWYVPSTDNAQRLARALIQFGFSAATIRAEMFESVGEIFRMGVPPFRIELISRVSGLEFEECYARRIDEVIDGILISIVSEVDLIKNKEAAGRTKDKADLEELLRIQQRRNSQG